ncbi:hypothetical protein ILUMI_01916 [Ignelater luminosus]|uniref:Uncharacterized protein n=1 Tax=Ignelater luminosus TaxID=2038154 RepID=A0A8K0DJ42_IGNLU|nr:hypothetical protein ILUMI_01916 [Ignelater luminosus]
MKILNNTRKATNCRIVGVSEEDTVAIGHPSCKDAARHFWRFELKKVVDSVIRRNAFFAPPENLLLSMLSNEQKHVRELAATRILKAIKTPISRQLRVFEVPKINLNASSYIDLIDWQQQYSQPSILPDVSNETLHSLVESGEMMKFFFATSMSHTSCGADSKYSHKGILTAL